jgi:hypothetical protein
MPREYVDWKVAQAMGVPYTEIDHVPVKAYMTVLACMNAEGKAKEDEAFSRKAAAKRTARK